MRLPDDEGEPISISGISNISGVHGAPDALAAGARASAPGGSGPHRPPPPPRPRQSGEMGAVTETSAVGAGFDELADWRKVFEEFLAMKRQCNEPIANLTFEKFKGTLQRNKDALVARHACNRVKFTVYAKDGKAALKASPVK
jgi:hypothetical protein